MTKKTIDDKLKKLSLVFSFEGVRKRIKGSIIILDSSMAEHPAVNRRVAGSSPARGVFIWSVGQGVKTPPFHGGNAGSNPARIIWRHSQVVRQRSATPLSPVQIRVAPRKPRLKAEAFSFAQKQIVGKRKKD